MNVCLRRKGGMDDTRQRLIDAAGPIFAEQGFRATTVRQICQAAEANVALVNYHFGDKERLYAEAVRCAARCCLERAPFPTWGPDVSPRRKLREFITTFLQRVAVEHEPAWHGQLILREIMVPTKAVTEFLQSHVQPTAELLRKILDELLPTEWPERQKQLVGFSIVGQILHYWSNRTVIALIVGEEEFQRLDVELLAEHITTFSLAAIDGLTRPAAPGPAARRGVLGARGKRARS